MKYCFAKILGTGKSRSAEHMPACVKDFLTRAGEREGNGLLLAEI